jgi:hypothetical protein
LENADFAERIAAERLPLHSGPILAIFHPPRSCR